MKTNEVYDVDGCKDFIPVIIDGIFDDGVAVTVSDEKRDYKLVVEEVYRFPKVHETQKVVVPRMILDTIESFDEDIDNLHDYISRQPFEVKMWIAQNERDFYKAWLAYPNITVEQEKLYTVEIPNPNNEYSMNVLIRLPSSGKIALIALHKPNTSYLKNKEYQLTESEIKQDFEWAWQWAKEVK